MDIYSEIAKLKKENRASALCIVIETKGSTPRKTGSKMIVTGDKQVIGTIGGGALEYEVTEKAIQLMATGQPGLFHFELKDDLHMECGGQTTVYIEPQIPDNRLVIFGGGHVGKAVARLSAGLGFRVTVIDDRREITESIHDPAIEIITESYETAIDNVVFDENTYIVVVTPKHAFDEIVTAKCAKKPFAYLGMIGSKRKVKVAREKFKNDWELTEEQIEAIDMPIGIPFEAETPEEIAVSILAKIIDVKNKRRKVG